MSKNIRVLRGGVAAAVLTGGLLAVGLGQVVAAGSASAVCAGAGNAYTSTISVNGQLVAWEVPESGTCNGNGAYSGTVSVISGWQVEVWRQNGGTWHDEQNGSGYFIWTGVSTHKSQEALCVRPDGISQVWTCGLDGGNTGQYGTFALGGQFPLNLGTLSYGF